MAERRPDLDARAITREAFGLMNTVVSAEEQDAQGYRPRRDLPPWPLAELIDWDADPFHDLNWRAHLQSWSVMDAYILAYFEEGASLQQCVPIVMGWAAWYPSADDRARSLSDAASGHRAKRLALLIDAHKSGRLDLTEHELDTLRALARRHADYLQQPGSIPMHNHGLSDVAGLYLLCEACREESWTPSAEATAAQAFADLLVHQFTPEGIHREHSPAYQCYAMRVLDGSYIRHRLTTPETDALLRQAGFNWPWFVLPNRELAPIGDSAAKNRPFRDTGGHEVNGYALAPFWRSGYGIVRSLPDVPLEDASMLFFMGARYSSSHKHDDDLSFTLFEFGANVLIDPGKYRYDPSPARFYFISRAAHNTIGLAEDAHRKTRIDAYGSALEQPYVEDDCFVLAGGVAWPGHRMDRTLIYKPREFLLVLDRVCSSRERNYVSRLNFDPSLEVQISGPTARATIGDRQLLVEFLASADLTSARGQEDPMKGWQSPDYNTVLPTTQIEGTCAGKDVSMGWIVSFSDEARAAAEERLTAYQGSRVV